MRSNRRTQVSPEVGVNALLHARLDPIDIMREYSREVVVHDGDGDGHSDSHGDAADLHSGHGTSNDIVSKPCKSKHSATLELLEKSQLEAEGIDDGHPAAPSEWRFHGRLVQNLDERHEQLPENSFWAPSVDSSRQNYVHHSMYQKEASMYSSRAVYQQLKLQEVHEVTQDAGNAGHHVPSRVSTSLTCTICVDREPTSMMASLNARRPLSACAMVYLVSACYNKDLMGDFLAMLRHETGVGVGGVLGPGPTTLDEQLGLSTAVDRGGSKSSRAGGVTAFDFGGGSNFVRRGARSIRGSSNESKLDQSHAGRHKRSVSLPTEVSQFSTGRRRRLRKLEGVSVELPVDAGPVLPDVDKRAGVLSPLRSSSKQAHRRRLSFDSHELSSAAAIFPQSQPRPRAVSTSACEEGGSVLGAAHPFDQLQHSTASTVSTPSTSRSQAATSRLGTRQALPPDYAALRSVTQSQRWLDRCLHLRKELERQEQARGLNHDDRFLTLNLRKRMDAVSLNQHFVQWSNAHKAHAFWSLKQNWKKARRRNAIDRFLYYNKCTTPKETCRKCFYSWKTISERSRRQRLHEWHKKRSDRVAKARAEIEHLRTKNADLKTKIGNNRLRTKYLEACTMANEDDFEKMHQRLVEITWLLHELSDFVGVNCITLQRMNVRLIHLFRVSRQLECLMVWTCWFIHLWRLRLPGVSCVREQAARVERSCFNCIDPSALQYSVEQWNVSLQTDDEALQRASLRNKSDASVNTLPSHELFPSEAWRRIGVFAEYIIATDNGRHADDLSRRYVHSPRIVEKPISPSASSSIGRYVAVCG